MSFGVDDTHYKREVAIPGIVNSVIEYECAEMSHDLLVCSFHHAILLLGVGSGHDMVYVCQFAIRGDQFIDELGASIRNHFLGNSQSGKYAVERVDSCCCVGRLRCNELDIAGECVYAH